MKKHAGYTLLELSIVLVVLGIVIVLIWRFVGFDADYALSNSQRALLRSADQAVSGFVLSNNRLPCPDTNGDGVEDCAGTTAVGTLPATTVGLSQANAEHIRYGVYRNASATPANDADLAVPADRMPMLATHGDPLAGYDLFQGNMNGIDLCAGLRNGANSAEDDNYLHVVTPEKHINVAYALAIAGRSDADQAGGLLDDSNAGGGVAFEAPSRVTDGNYDDRVVAVGFDRLIGRLNCSETLAAVTHAHANAATWAEITHQAMLDYKIQLDLIAELAQANVDAAAAAVAIGAAGVASSLADVSEGLAESLLTDGAEAEVEVLAVLAQVASDIGLGLASAETGPAAHALASANQNVTNFANREFVIRSADLATRIRQDANDADAAGTYCFELTNPPAFCH
ncbi:MAG: prepilin-type N-terminal cleavage/methylation domain-containing protein [Rhodanobacteraceae bacterium]